jgi:peptidoglycan/xylan/chitin deacetylase (PgdA/CDA1 family)
MSNQKLPILTYHNIEKAPACRLPRLYVEPAEFARQMAWLARLGYRGVSLSEGLARLRAGKAARCAVLTFDDGYVDNLVHAAPVLGRFGFGATCFIVSDHIGDHNRWDTRLGEVSKPLMHAGQLREWQARGLELGSHTRSHPRLHELPADLALQEVVGSRRALQELTGAPIAHFCYPYGDCSAAVAAIVRGAGYESAVTGRRGRARASDDPFQLPRLSVNGGKSLLKFLLKVATPYADVGQGAARQA